MNCACVDIGTNTTRLLVAERDGGRLREVDAVLLREARVRGHDRRERGHRLGRDPTALIGDVGE